MKNIIRILLSIILLTSCNYTKSSKLESEGVQKVVDFFGGTCTSSKGIRLEKGIPQEYFELKMSNSKLLNTYSNMPELVASNIAYIFYSNLGEEEKKYDYIEVVILFSDKNIYKYECSMDNIQKAYQLIPIWGEVTEKMKQQDCDSLLNYFDTNVVDVDVKFLKTYCNSYDSAYGKISKIEFQGFMLFDDGIEEYAGKTMIHLAGITLREKKRIPISLYIDTKSKKILRMDTEY